MWGDFDKCGGDIDRGDFEVWRFDQVPSFVCHSIDMVFCYMYTFTTDVNACI